MPCRSRDCQCGIISNSLVITGDGQPWQIESNGITVVTSVTRPPAPFLGQVIYETDTDRTYLYDGAAWRIQHDPNESVLISYSPGSTTDASTSTSPASWLAGPNVTVPPWATRALVSVSANGQYMTADVGAYFIYPRLNAVNSNNNGFILFYGGVNQRQSVGSECLWTGLTPGATIPFSLWSALSSGAGVLRADTFTRVTAKFDWRES